MHAWRGAELVRTTNEWTKYFRPYTWGLKWVETPFPGLLFLQSRVPSLKQRCFPGRKDSFFITSELVNPNLVKITA